MAESKSNSIDIGRQQIGKVYATALLRACSHNIDEVLGELQFLVQDVFDRVPQLDTTLSSPRLSIDEKERILDNSLQSVASGDLMRFLKVVCRHERLDCLRDIYREAHKMRNEERGVLEFQMVTAQPVDEQFARTIAGQIKQKFGADIELHTLTDPSLIGGVLIRNGDTVYDASIARQLEMMREDAVAKTVALLRQRPERFATE